MPVSCSNVETPVDVMVYVAMANCETWCAKCGCVGHESPSEASESASVPQVVMGEMGSVGAIVG